MKTPLILSVAAAAVLSINLHAEDAATAANSTDRMQAMEEQIKELQSQLKAIKTSTAAKADTAESDDEADDDEESPQEQIDDLQDQISNINRNTAGNHLKFGVDFRTSVDNLQYKMADGSKQGNDALLANRLWVNMDWAATENMSFTGQLAYNKFYGQRSGFGPGNVAPLENFDWVVNENPYDDNVRVRSAYFFYHDSSFLGASIPWTFSIGRRPSTNGHLINLRDNDRAASPMGHNINVEFDGLSAKFAFEDVTGIPGMYIKFCAGRGGTNANAKFFDMNTSDGTVSSAAPYASNSASIPDIDLGGAIFVPYDDGQYSLNTQYYYAANLIDAGFTGTGQFAGFQKVGGLHALTANFVINGIGDEWSDFLDDTIFFASGAWSITNPDKNGMGMLGSTESKTGSSYWVGLQMPTGFSDEGRFGLEYNHGDKYWRSITYAEDTLIGSKMAARGSAYEAYYTDYLIEDVFSFQLRYTYIDYDYTGSNGFFGSTTGTPYSIDDIKAGTAGPYAPSASSVVSTAQDIRFYLRYRY